MKELLIIIHLASSLIFIVPAVQKEQEVEKMCYPSNNSKVCYPVASPEAPVEPMPTPAQPVASEDIYQYAERRCSETFGDGYYQDLYELVTRESGWNENAQNPTSTAYGLFQFLNSTWAGTGIDKTDDPRSQVEAGLLYISNRYDDPTGALRFHTANGWY